MALTKVKTDGVNDDAITAGKIPANAIGSSEIADNAVGLDQMAGLARGKIIYGDASGNPAALAIGTSGKTLVSDGTDISWGEAAAGATGGGSDKCFWENSNTITTSYTISNNMNAGTFGPVTVNSGATVTVGSGETWVII
tara:strand:+ start:443 stop:862 length:420 start_codon:yes stop_codon:yes gene_type:complete